MYKVLGVTLLLLTVVLLLGCSRSGSSNVVGSYEFMGLSMEPTYHDGDPITIVKLGTNPLQRGDIILFIAPDQAPDQPERYFIKRVIALPNETVEVRSGNVYVNGQQLAEPYIAEPPNYTYGQIVVRSDNYFVLGDNRNNSADSHIWGPVPLSKILGRTNSK